MLTPFLLSDCMMSYFFMVINLVVFSGQGFDTPVSYTHLDVYKRQLRLLEPMQAGNIVVPKNTLVAGTAKVQGERLDILAVSYTHLIFLFRLPVRLLCGRAVLILLYVFHIAVCLTG